MNNNQWSECKLTYLILKSSFKYTNETLSLSKNSLHLISGNYNFINKKNGFIKFSKMSPLLKTALSKLIEESSLIKCLDYDEVVEKIDYKNQLNYKLKSLVRESIQFKQAYLHFFGKGVNNTVFEIINCACIYSLMLLCYKYRSYFTHLKAILNEEELIDENYISHLLKIINSKTNKYGIISFNEEELPNLICKKHGYAYDKQNTVLTDELEAILILIRESYRRPYYQQELSIYRHLILNIIIDNPSVSNEKIFFISDDSIFDFLNEQYDVVISKRKLNYIKSRLRRNLGFEIQTQPFSSVNISKIKLTFVHEGELPDTTETLLIIYDNVTKYVFSAIYLTGEPKQLKDALRDLLPSEKILPSILCIDPELMGLFDEMIKQIVSIGCKILIENKIHTSLIHFLKCHRSKFEDIVKFEILEDGNPGNLIVVVPDITIDEEPRRIINDTTLLLPNVILNEFNNSANYKVHGLSSPKQCISSLKFDDSLLINDELYAQLFYNDFKCQITSKICTVEINNKVFWFFVKKSIKQGHGKAYIDPLNPELYSCLAIDNLIHPLIYYTTTVKENNDEILNYSSLPKVINVREEISNLLRIEFGIEEPSDYEKVSTRTRVLRKLKRKSHDKSN